MKPPNATARYSLIETERDVEASFSDEVESGLTATPKTIPCRFLYDNAGSKLFEEICAVPEYYVTRAEREILDARSDEIAARFSRPITLAELGSGNSAKTRLLIEAFLQRHGGLRYVPVDISRAMLEDTALKLLARYAGLEIRAIAGEYHGGLRHVHAETGRPKLIAWLGSNVGNFDRDEACSFLRRIRAALEPGDGLLIGIDLRKDRETLERAYDDSRGVTARFSLNLLSRINRELGGGFDLAQFRHRARYREDEGRVEISLVSRRAQRVAIEDLDLEVEFARDEAIFTEDAFKYSPDEIETLARDSGLRVDAAWMDRSERFRLNLFVPTP